MVEWSDLITKYTDDLTLEEAFEIIRLYVAAVKEGDDLMEIRIASKIWAIFEKPEHSTPAHYDALLNPILHPEETDSDNVFVLNRMAVAYALKKPACPAYLLSAACHQTASPAYAVIAAANPACPAEDAVYAVLTYTDY